MAVSQVIGHIAAQFPGAIQSLEPTMDALRQRALTSNEATLLQVLTNPGEALIVTDARVIILKDASKSGSSKPVGRYFALTELQSVRGNRGFLFGGNLVFITNQTATEVVPRDLSRCSFAVTFRDSTLWQNVKAYIDTVLAAVVHAQANAVANGALRPISVANVIARQREAFYYESTAIMYAERTRRVYQGGTQGMSFRVMPGVYYRVGGMRGHSESQSAIERVDDGRVILSNQRMLFVGARETVDVPLVQVVAVTPYSNGFAVHLAKGKMVQFETNEGLGGMMLQRLCTNPP